MDKLGEQPQLLPPHPKIEQERLKLFIIKLIGDFGQELYAAANDYIFFANARPSALRYMLIKTLAWPVNGDNSDEMLYSCSGGGVFLHQIGII